MKARLYDAGEKFTTDRYTLFLHYPKIVMQRVFNKTGKKIIGMGVRCDQDSDGNLVVTRVIDWEESFGSPSKYNGHKVELSQMPQPFQDRARLIENTFTQATRDEQWYKVTEALERE